MILCNDAGNLNSLIYETEDRSTCPNGYLYHNYFAFRWVTEL